MKHSSSSRNGASDGGSQAVDEGVNRKAASHSAVLVSDYRSADSGMADALWLRGSFSLQPSLNGVN